MGAAGHLREGELHMAKTSNPQTASKAPSHVAYHVRDREGQKGFWARIGAAWEHADGSGFNIQLEAFPLDGRVVLRVAKEQKD
jgi:hypothetical protein